MDGLPYTSLLSERESAHLAVTLTSLQDDFPENIRSLVEIRRELAQQLGGVIDSAEGFVPDEESEILASLRINLANVAALDVLSDAAAVSQAKTAQQETAGDVAESELAKEFAVYGNWQNRTGYIWLAAAVVLFAATVAIATIVLKQVDQAFNWYSLAAHLLIALPCLGLGAYCARESSRHRELAQWARRLAVQLKSVGAYSARLDDMSRLWLLAQFGSSLSSVSSPARKG